MTIKASRLSGRRGQTQEKGRFVKKNKQTNETKKANTLSCMPYSSLLSFSFDIVSRSRELSFGCSLFSPFKVHYVTQGEAERGRVFVVPLCSWAVEGDCSGDHSC